MNIQIGYSYRNQLGVELEIKGHAMSLGRHVIGDIWVGEVPDNIFGPTQWLVTEQGLEGSGYTKAAS